MSRPFLNRRQLWLLIILLPGVILLLSLLGPLPGGQDLQISEDRRLYQMRQSREDYQLQLLLPLPAPDTAERWLVNRLLPDVMKQRLSTPEAQQWLQQQQWQIVSSNSDTEWQLLIQTSAPPDNEQLRSLLQHLTAPVDMDWTQRVNTSLATRYLNLHTPDEAALAALQPGTFPRPWQVTPASLLDEWVTSERLLMTLQTPEFLPLTAPAVPDAKTGPATTVTATPLPSADPAGQGVLHHWRWSAPADLEGLARTQLALACVQEQLSLISQGNFRLRWRAWHGFADLDLLLQQTALKPEQLLSCPDQDRYDQLRQQLAEYWEGRLAADASTWLLLLARHRLPAETPDRLVSQLEQLQRSDIQQHLQRLAGSDTYRRLNFLPVTEDPHAPSQ